MTNAQRFTAIGRMLGLALRHGLVVGVSLAPFFLKQALLGETAQSLRTREAKNI